MVKVQLASLLIIAQLSAENVVDKALTTKHCTQKGGCQCDCSWANSGTCKNDDGSCCWACCCGSTPTPPPGPKIHGTPCPVEADGAGGASLIGTNGFSTHGQGRIRSKQKQNLLGGGITFTLDLSGCKNLVNCNLQLVIPGTLGNNPQYCDNGGTAPPCIELDVIETNSDTIAASTMHTKLGKGVGGCDTWGCRKITYLNGPIYGYKPFDVSVSFSNEGGITITYSQNGQSVVAFSNIGQYDASAASAIVNGMKYHGAIIVSGMWTGWVPPNTSGNGDLAGSTFKMTNLKVSGQVVGTMEGI